MEIVIKIPEKAYEHLLRTQKFPKGFDITHRVIHGKPLPKGHGRLIDADALKLTQHDIHVESINYSHRCISVENVDEAQTIIETDKEVGNAGSN